MEHSSNELPFLYILIKKRKWPNHHRYEQQTDTNNTSNSYAPTIGWHYVFMMVNNRPQLSIFILSTTYTISHKTLTQSR